MAIYDPPDGNVDPRPRCVGHCCRCFSTEKSFAEINEDVKQLRLGKKSTIPDVEIIADMLIPIGKVRSQEIFTCKHLKNNQCTIYSTRPQMCRDFPGPDPCKYRNCASHGQQNFIKRALNWIRE